MSKIVHLKKGFNINLAGKAEKKLDEIGLASTHAIKPTDFIHLTRPKLSVNIGDKVNAGDTVIYDKLAPQVKYVAPVSGEITEIVRGEKRKILEVKIKTDSSVTFREFNKFTPSEINSLSKEQVIEQICEGGAWANFIQRPYAVVANPTDTPQAIYISAFDSAPLAPDYAFIYKGQEQYFQAGIDLIKKLTSGVIHLNVNADAEVAPIFEHAKNVTVNKFSGKHPVGNVGIQIHHIKPINKGDLVWTISPYGVIQIGKLFLDGKYDASKIIAITGSEVANPRYAKVYSGTQVTSLVSGLKSENVRVVSGNPLSGEKISKDGFLGFYHNQITVLPEGNHGEFLGWILPSTKKLSFHRAIGLLSFLNGSNKEYVINTNLKGEERAFVQTGAFEKLVPMDIYPTYLLKAILAEDFEDMEGLGIYEVAEEDFALCEFIDVSKNPIQEIIREGIELIRNS